MFDWKWLKDLFKPIQPKGHMTTEGELDKYGEGFVDEEDKDKEKKKSGSGTRSLK